MVQTCCIPNCKERQNRDTNVSFHKFPKDPQLREKWIEAINCKNFEPSAHSRICSKHFGSDCFVGASLSSRRNLTIGAVPCVSKVLEVPSMQIIESASLNNEFESSNEDNSLGSAACTAEDNSAVQETRTKRMRTSYIGDFLKSDVISDQETFKHLVEKTLESKNKQIKALQRTNKRLFKKVEDLQGLLDENYKITSENYARNLSLYVSDIVEYIAGFVIKKIKKTVQCETCLRAVESQNSQNEFLNIKNYSKVKQALTVPSSDVVRICKIAEAEVRIAEKTNSLTHKNLIQKLILKTMHKVKSNVFKEFDEHMYDHNVESNHIIHLIKIVSYYYINIRLYYISNQKIEKENSRIRNKLTKTILFCNQ